MKTFSILPYFEAFQLLQHKAATKKGVPFFSTPFQQVKLQKRNEQRHAHNNCSKQYRSRNKPARTTLGSVVA